MSSDIPEFLMRVKERITSKRRKFIKNNKTDHIVTLAKLGITSSDEAYSQVLRLKPGDYHMKSAEAMIFSKYINGDKAFIYLNIDEHDYICVSFHS